MLSIARPEKPHRATDLGLSIRICYLPKGADSVCVNSHTGDASQHPRKPFANAAHHATALLIDISAMASWWMLESIREANEPTPDYRFGLKSESRLLWT